MDLRATNNLAIRSLRRALDARRSSAGEINGNGLFTRTLSRQLASGEVFEKYGRPCVSHAELFGTVEALVAQLTRGQMTPSHRRLPVTQGGELESGGMLFARPCVA